MSKKVALIILDGWGYGDQSASDVIFNAKTPFFEDCLKKYPHAHLKTFGEHVGLPNGQMGNSEVGHLNIGAGRVVYQDLMKVNQAIADGSFTQNSVLLEAFRHAKEKNVAVHFMGLLSDGGIHSHEQHLYALCEMANAAELKDVYVHAFMDGRDCDPKSGLGHIKKLQAHLNNSTGKLASVIGRYYAMDRDNRWERIKKAYDMLIHSKGAPCENLANHVNKSYEQGITDEFILPAVQIDAKGNAIGSIKENDVVICFNFRTDRCREITTALSQKDFPEHELKKIPLHYVTMTNYDRNFNGVEVVFDKDDLKNTLGEVLEKNGKSQIRIAETEKYPHVTFFFSGGREIPFSDEKRILINSPKVATYDLQPEMSAQEVTDAIINEMEKETADFVCLNFANPDMVGHTGVYPAIVKAVEKVDQCTSKIVTTGLQHGYSFLIIADHGNADYAVNEDGSPNTAHTTNLVPCILIDDHFTQMQNGKLADVAPTVLKLFDIPPPKEMNGKTLI